MKLLCPSIKGLQQMIEMCKRFGEKYSVKYNAKKSMCMVYDQFVDRSAQFNDSINIMLNGSRLILFDYGSLNCLYLMNEW